MTASRSTADPWRIYPAFAALTLPGQDERSDHPGGTATRPLPAVGRLHRGTTAEGLLLNVRMVNAVFEDRKRPTFDADRNTDAFIKRLPDYVAAGVRAITLNLQGGMPGYEGAVNSAFWPDGSLRPGYLRRVA